MEGLQLLLPVTKLNVVNEEKATLLITSVKAGQREVRGHVNTILFFIIHVFLGMSTMNSKPQCLDLALCMPAMYGTVRAA